MPAAMTLSTASFYRADAEQAERTLGTCRQLIDAFLRRAGSPADSVRLG